MSASDSLGRRSDDAIFPWLGTMRISVQRSAGMRFHAGDRTQRLDGSSSVQGFNAARDRRVRCAFRCLADAGAVWVEVDAGHAAQHRGLIEQCLALVARRSRASCARRQARPQTSFPAAFACEGVDAHSEDLSQFQQPILDLRLALPERAAGKRINATTQGATDTTRYTVKRAGDAGIDGKCTSRSGICNLPGGTLRGSRARSQAAVRQTLCCGCPDLFACRLQVIA